MNHYQQTLSVAADPAAVYAALTTKAGLQGWWTQDCDVDTQVGGTVKFRFGQHYKHMRIEALSPGREVRWLCTVAHIDVNRFQHKDEWVGTQLVFHLTPSVEGGTRLEFEHVGLVPSFECYDLCQNGWQHFMGSLQHYVETGVGEPFRPAETCLASAAA
ncbi:SRPBCC family protein [Chitinolyticbacter albus]|uniref:SRPBCC family protein n=1 Tax=Chitinolyticbacter albus TaxID=2961951 RepID=UPI00210A2EEE|nr:SRPBCC domain-containing protein [Chitinolyticbacter albus]